MNKYFDHTLLKAFATQRDIEKLCNEALQMNTASVCVNPKWISFCKEKLKTSDVKVCTVIGFPLGADPGNFQPGGMCLFRPAVRHSGLRCGLP